VAISPVRERITTPLVKGLDADVETDNEELRARSPAQVVARSGVSRAR